jgi:hypothetical protein
LTRESENPLEQISSDVHERCLDMRTTSGEHDYQRTVRHYRYCSRGTQSMNPSTKIQSGHRRVQVPHTHRQRHWSTGSLLPPPIYPHPAHGAPHPELSGVSCKSTQSRAHGRKKYHALITHMAYPRLHNTTREQHTRPGKSPTSLPPRDVFLLSNGVHRNRFGTPGSRPREKAGTRNSSIPGHNCAS